MNQLQRYTLNIPLEYSQRIRSFYGENGQKQLLKSVQQLMENDGFTDIKLVMQDPTNNSIFTVLGRGKSNNLNKIYKITKIENVEEPPSSSANNYQLSTPFLDSGLLPDEIATVRHALLNDENPRHLSGFASTFEPYFPIASSLLRAKAMLRECCAIRNRMEIRNVNRLAAENISKAAIGLEKQTLDWLDVKPYEKVLTSKLSDLWPELASVWQKYTFANQPGWFRFDKMLFLKNRQNLTNDITVSQLKQLLLDYSQQSKVPIEILQDEVKRVACLLIQEPQSFLEPETLSKFPPIVVQLGKKLVEEIGLGIWSINPQALKLACPPSVKDGYVSPSAMQLALAASKPNWSGVTFSEKLPKILNDLSNTNDVQLMKARAQMERAERAIERRRWINWYRQNQLIADSKS